MAAAAGICPRRSALAELPLSAPTMTATSVPRRRLSVSAISRPKEQSIPEHMHAISIHKLDSLGPVDFAPMGVQAPPAFQPCVTHRRTSSSDAYPNNPSDRRFWMVFVALAVSSFLSALDLTSISTVLPTLAADFKSPDYAWVGSAQVEATQFQMNHV